VKYDVAVDFAALCSNCHRMINRFSEPSDLVAFRKFISVKNVATHYTQATVADPRSGEDFE